MIEIIDLEEIYSSKKYIYKIYKIFENPMHRLFCFFYITWTLNKEKKLIRKFLKSFQKDLYCIILHN